MFGKNRIPHQPTVLIAEDETMLQELYKEVCDSLGLACIQCFEGLETWNAIEDLIDEIDVIILDIMMPGLSGEGVLSKLTKKYPNHPPTIVVSAIAETKGDIDDLKPGEVVYLAKGDVSLKAILTAVVTFHEKREGA